MRILAVDSGLEKTGYSISLNNNHQYKYLGSGLIKTAKDKKFSVRAAEIFNRLNDVISKYKPEKIVLEQLFFFHNQKTAIQIAQIQGVVILLASQKKIDIEFLTPLQIKLAVTGYGLSDKKAVRKMVNLTLKIKKVIKEDDEIDAIACGLAYCYLNK